MVKIKTKQVNKKEFEKAIVNRNRMWELQYTKKYSIIYTMFKWFKNWRNIFNGQFIQFIIVYILAVFAIIVILFFIIDMIGRL